MTKAAIVCGTDFSTQAMQAGDVAAALAKKLNEALVLVHAADPTAREGLPDNVQDSLCTYERGQLHEELERLRMPDVPASEVFCAGKPDEVLIETATKKDARLLIVSSHGRKAPERWMLGSVAEKVAQSAPMPTLVVRDAAPFLRWLRGRRPLRVFIGADFSEQSEAALRWVAWLREIGPCFVVIAHLEPLPMPTEPFDPMHSSIVLEMVARTEAAQTRAMRKRAREILGGKGLRVRVEKGWGRSDARLIEVAREEVADLIVIGTHQRHGLARLGHHSTSRGVLHYAPMNVACVPLPPPRADLTGRVCVR